MMLSRCRILGSSLIALLCLTVGCAQGNVDDEGDDGLRSSPSTEPKAGDASLPPPPDTSPDESEDTEIRDTTPPDAAGRDADGTSTRDVASDGDSSRDGETDAGDTCEGRCGDVCQQQQASCGRVTFDGGTVQCGSCPSDQYCNRQNTCTDICQGSNAQCGEVFWGGKRESCGTCADNNASCLYNRCVQDGGYRAVAAGARHTCAVRSNGQVECWGSNDTQQVGTSDGGPFVSPIEIDSLSNAVDVSANFNHTCAMTRDNEVYCWGLNEFAQSGADADTQEVGEPNRVTPLEDARDTATGSGHSCAVLQTGGARCWGEEQFGQLGNGESRPRVQDAPVTVQNASNDFVGLSGGDAHTCGLGESGEVWCWGNSSKGKLGRGVRPASPAQPERVMSSPGRSLQGVVDLSVGSNHACAALQAGDLRCWGNGGEGQIGDDGRSNRFFATEVSNVSEAWHVATGKGHSCMIRRDGSVACWGDNRHGQLGIGQPADRYETPVDIPNFGGIVDIAAGHAHTCAINRQGELYCWGRNDSGQVGNGSKSSTPVTTPAEVRP